MKTEITYLIIDIPSLIVNSIAPVAVAIGLGVMVGVIGLGAIAIWSKVLSIKARQAERPAELIR